MTRLSLRSGYSWFPSDLQAAAARRLTELCGVALAAFAALLLIGLLSFHAGDPSFNHATAAAPRNLLGTFGSHSADVLLHALGLAVALPVVALGVWGSRMVGRMPLTAPGLRLGALALATVLLATAAAALPAPDSWPLGVPLGGLVGLLTLHALHGVAGSAAIAVACGATGLGLGLASLGLKGEEWAAIGRRAVAVSRWVLRQCRRLRHLRALSTLAQRLGLAGRSPGLLRQQADAADVTPRYGALQPLPEEAEEMGAPSAQGPELVTAANPEMRRSRHSAKAGQGRLELERTAGEGYRTPPVQLLHPAAPLPVTPAASRDSLEQNARLLSSVLEDFGVRGEIVKIRPGPVVTLYELEPAPGTKTSRVIGLADDIARSMSAISVRVAVVPGRNVIGIELPNQRREMVLLRELFESEAYERSGGQLTLVLGKDIGGGGVFVDLARMPHLLIAGTTGSGKSVAINTMILSLLYQMPPDICRFILIDPKMLELSVYDGIPHLLSPVVTDPAKAVVALKWTVREMEERYRMMSQLGVRNIAGFNARVAEAKRKGESLVRRVQTGFADDGRPVFEDQPLDLESLPFIVVVVDEMADLMLVAGKDIEAAVQRLAQMARAAGIHLIMATQRPSVDVITGTIKANFPTRISFHVTSKVDSRTILGEQGAEQLLGQGDMLYMATGGRVTRVHGPFVSDEEVESVVQFLCAQGEPQYLPEVTEDGDELRWPAGEIGTGAGESGDDLYDEAVAIIAREGKASTSFVQRRLQIGYNRAARLIERMEAEGVVSSPDRVGRREVLVGDHSG